MIYFLLLIIFILVFIIFAISSVLNNAITDIYKELSRIDIARLRGREWN